MKGGYRSDRGDHQTDAWRYGFYAAPPRPNWWERNRVRATVLAAIFLMLVLALASPWIHR